MLTKGGEVVEKVRGEVSIQLLKQNTQGIIFLFH